MALVTDRSTEVRAVEPSDCRDILELLTASLGWSSGELLEFSWKHEDTPFGRCTAWATVDNGLVVAFRTCMRWEPRAPGGELLGTGRAVDTAARPSHQGRGVFRQLMPEALDDLRTQGVAVVFNAPSDKSPVCLTGLTTVGRRGARRALVRSVGANAGVST
jgi:GNAT superfamily N-acetyltransferase